MAKLIVTWALRILFATVVTILTVVLIDRIVAQDKPKPTDPPTPAAVAEVATALNAEEDRALLLAFLRRVTAELQQANALIQGKLDVQLVKETKLAADVYKQYMETLQKKHNAVGMDWQFGERKWTKP